MNRIDVRRWGSSYLNTVGMQNVGRDVKRKGPRYFNEDELRVEALKLFSRSLVEKGYGMKRPDLLKKNIIDFRGLIPDWMLEDYPTYVPPLPLDQDQEFKTYLMTHDLFYTMMPCFDECVYRLNTARYAHLKIISVDSIEREFEIWVMDYMRVDGAWSPGESGKVRFKIGSSYEENMELFSSSDGIVLYPQIYRMSSAEEAGMNAGQKEVWDKLAIPFAEKVASNLLEADKSMNGVMLLGQTVCAYSSLLNYFLSLNKPAAAKGNRPKKKPDTARHKEGNEAMEADQKPRTRILRSVGPINVQSVKRPREVTARSAAKYTIAAWGVRGHLRRCKSGKTVWIKPTVHRRKSLQDKGAVKNRQQIIKLEKGKGG